MARALVLVGRPVDLEDGEFEFQNGDRKGEKQATLTFALMHPALAVTGAVQCDAWDEDVRKKVHAAHEAGESIQVVAIPKAFQYADKRTGEPATFIKMNVRAVL